MDDINTFADVGTKQSVEFTRASQATTVDELTTVSNSESFVSPGDDGSAADGACCRIALTWCNGILGVLARVAR